jgi:hypothetical protein
VTLNCSACHARTDAPLCAICTKRLEEVIAELPADLHDLQAVAARQAAGPLGLGPGEQWDGKPTDDALEVTPWPFAPGAADLRWVARNTLTTWTRHLIESGRATDLPAATAPREFYVERNRMHIFTSPPTLSLPSISRWLLANLDAIRQDDAAGDIYDELVSLHTAMDLAILGRPGLDEFYGLCDAIDVRVVPLVIIGPRCYGFTCPHESCATVRNDAGTLTTKVGQCGAQLHGRNDDAEIQCQACGVKYLTADRKAAMREKLPDKLGTIREVAGALTSLDRPVTEAAIDSAVRRNHIPERGRNGQGHRLVRVGDVEAYLERQAQRTSHRQDRMSA